FKRFALVKSTAQIDGWSYQTKVVGRDLDVLEGMGRWFFGGDVHHTARVAHAVQHRGRTFHHFYLLNVGALAVSTHGISETVFEHTLHISTETADLENIG